MCDRCAELEEEVAYLKSELASWSSEQCVETLARVLRIRPAAAKTLARLYASGGRLVGIRALMEATADPACDDDRDYNVVKVHVWNLRQVLGRDAIQTAWGRGYSLTETGVARVAAILEPVRQEAA